MCVYIILKLPIFRDWRMCATCTMTNTPLYGSRIIYAYEVWQKRKRLAWSWFSILACALSWVSVNLGSSTAGSASWFPGRTGIPKFRLQSWCGTGNRYLLQFAQVCLRKPGHDAASGHLREVGRHLGTHFAHAELLQQSDANRFAVNVELLCHHAHGQSAVASHKLIHFAYVVSSFCYGRPSRSIWSHLPPLRGHWWSACATQTNAHVTSWLPDRLCVEASNNLLGLYPTSPKTSNWCAVPFCSSTQQLQIVIKKMDTTW